MGKKQHILSSFLFVLTACQVMQTAPEKPPHPAIGKWAEKGKCHIMPWQFNPYTVSWGLNSGTWQEEQGGITVKAHIDQDNAVMNLRLSAPQNNRMTILSADYGGTRINNLKGQLIRCP